ncbi:YbaK/EbsC family protein [Mycobacterium sp. shizuoka-1]|uniref:YbaK/EbsC family protein n=1 Tax=Mycobacterium sp. shizuoka-1 TaxID=2039281 RepID=UPI000C063E09|nr:YbaK/EbsC family protein [Mycobacterium sp. shizuoka-1]GAY19036.1 Cys-tRNA(Pro)/Cys-tRNA(Cys) deacylase [Mycobacterium sp. shizuoka-1]
MSRAATPAIAALAAAGAPYEVLRYHHDPRAHSYGEEAVTALAGDRLVPEQIFKTLVIAAGPVLAVAVLPVPWKLSLKAAAAALGLAKVTMADQTAAERATGYVLGGISPLGQRKRLATVVDSSALTFDTVLCSAGKRGWDIALAPQDLVRLTQAVTADLRAV